MIAEDNAFAHYLIYTAIRKGFKESMITMDLRRIRCAKDLKESANDALKVAEDVLAPRLTDWGLLDTIYLHFKKFLREVSPQRTEKRREFLFIAVYLYCPSVLVGATMPRGLRGKLKNILNVESPSAISNYTADLFFLYNHYKDFRTLVEEAYAYISKAMNFEYVQKNPREIPESKS